MNTKPCATFDKLVGVNLPVEHPLAHVLPHGPPAVVEVGVLPAKQLRLLVAKLLQALPLRDGREVEGHWVGGAVAAEDGARVAGVGHVHLAQDEEGDDGRAPAKHLVPTLILSDLGGYSLM